MYVLYDILRGLWLTVAHQMYTDNPAAFAEAGDNASRGTHFFEEAVRFWQLEEGQAKLTNLQGLTNLIVW